MRINKNFVVALGVGVVVSGQAFAGIQAERAQELIVRLKNPKSLRQHSIYLGLDGGSAPLSVLNAEEGLVKLPLKADQDLAAAQSALMASGAVESVAPNFLYRPQLKLQMRETNELATDDSLELAPMNSFLGILTHVIPPVVSQPSQATGADPLAAQDWSLASIHMPANVQVAGSVLTAVIDTGVDYNHEDLTRAMWHPTSNSQAVGMDFVHPTQNPYDVVHFDPQGCMADPLCSAGFQQEKFMSNPGHGTHCAGHVAAVYNNATGIRGVGAGARLMALKMFYDAGEIHAGQGDDAAAIKSIDYAVANGVKVISASWGGSMSAADADQSELKAALIRAQNAGVLFIVAAGNDSKDQDSDPEPSYPAAYNMDNMIVVGATDQNDQLADFSNYGAKKVDIGAPGVKIFSTTVGSQYSDVVAKITTPKGRVVQIDWDGTSMATPIVAGAAALIWSKHPTENYHQIRDRILNSARKVVGLQGKVATGGVLDVEAALK